jgi:hypothetical protein
MSNDNLAESLYQMIIWVNLILNNNLGKSYIKQ